MSYPKQIWKISLHIQSNAEIYVCNIASELFMAKSKDKRVWSHCHQILTISVYHTEITIFLSYFGICKLLHVYNFLVTFYS